MRRTLEQVDKNRSPRDLEDSEGDHLSKHSTTKANQEVLQGGESSRSKDGKASHQLSEKEGCPFPCSPPAATLSDPPWQLWQKVALRDSQGLKHFNTHWGTLRPTESHRSPTMGRALVPGCSSVIHCSIAAKALAP